MSGYYVVHSLNAKYFGRKLKGSHGVADVMAPITHSRTGTNILSGGETYVALKPKDREKIQGQKVALIGTGYPGPNHELEGIKQLLYNLGRTNDESLDNLPFEFRKSNFQPASYLELYFLCCPYQKQDDVFEAGEVNRALLLLLEFSKLCDRITLIDPHFITRSWAQEMIDNGTIRVLSLYQLLMDKVKEEYGDDVIFVSPGKYDRTGMPRMDTRRLRIHDVEIGSIPDLGNVKNRRIAVIDDVLYGGATLEESADELLKIYDPEGILTAVSHVGEEAGLRLILRKESPYEHVYVTDTTGIPDSKGGNSEKLTVLSAKDTVLESFDF